MPTTTMTDITNTENSNSTPDLANGSTRERKQQQLDKLTGSCFNPNQDPEEVKDITRAYQSLQRLLNEERSQLVKSASTSGRYETETGREIEEDGLLKITDQANRLNSRVRRTHEAVLDSKVLMAVGDIGVERARQLKMNYKAFETELFLSKILGKMGEQVNLGNLGREEADEMISTEGEALLNWNLIGKIAKQYTRKAPCIDFMLGPLSILPKTRRAHQQRQRNDNILAGEVVRVQELHEEDLQRDTNQTTTNVVELDGLLRPLGQVNMIKFITNPESYSQTVENMFHLSFLIREGKVHLFQDEETGMLMIEAVEVPTLEDYRQGLIGKQVMMDMTMEMWRQSIEIFEIRKSMIPTRKVVETNGTKWYA